DFGQFLARGFGQPGAVHHQLADQGLLGAEIVADGGVVFLAGGLGDLFLDLLDDLGGLMNQPERRYVFLLAMGDRWNGSLYKTSGFSNLWGAGRIRLRKYDADGMDAPAELRFDQFCVPASTDVIRPINDGYALPADAAYIKVVTWWYDPRLESGNTHDKMTLTLQSWDGSAWVDEVTDSSDDTKQMVFLDDAEAVPYRVKVTGRDVTAHHPGCEADEMKVFHQVYWEDNDRDDGPELDLIRPEYLP
ncbi:MAG TPA: hypothetical protein PKC57_12750, partial [Microthrixaceae bacterium]|nr:hypothetical protein [Microthrixaceae bacterium]